MTFKKNRRGKRPRLEASRALDLVLSQDNQGLFFEDDISSGESAYRAGPKFERKTNQLCRQIRDRLDLVISSEIYDPSVDGAWVNSVTPMSGARRLLVSVVVPDVAEIDAALATLTRMSGLLRSEVGAAISRKRTPELVYTVVPEAMLSGGADE